VAKYTGKDMAVRFGTFSVAGQGRQLEVSQSADEVDVTTYGSTDKEFLAGLIDRTATLDILDDSTNANIRNAFKTGTSNSLAWFPLGIGTGLPKFSVGTAVVTEANLSYPYDDAVVVSVSMRLSGAVTEGTSLGGTNP
jgi:predicted secreted protein